MEHPPRNIDMTCFNWVKLILKTDLPANAKYIALYLSTFMNLHQDMAFPALKRIEGETGLSHPSVLKYLKLLETEGWIIKQSGDRVTSNRYWVNIPNAHELRVGKEATYVTSGEKVGKEATSNNNRITNTLSKGFKRPSVEEVKTYCDEKGYSIDPETFVNYYNSNGWKVGRASMKCWKSATTNWQKREKQNGRKQGGRDNSRGCVEQVSISDLINQRDVTERRHIA